MRLRSSMLALGGAGILLLPWAAIRGDTPGPGSEARAQVLPPLEAPYPLPPLPERSPRNASYTIEARLDPEAHSLEGHLVLEWRNTSDTPLTAFPFHLYWNAFRNNLSTSARGERRRPIEPAYAWKEQERRYGFIHVRSLKLLAASETDLTPTLRYIHPDDDNADDRTVMEVRTPSPVPPGATVRFGIDWTSRVPFGDAGRAGWIHDYHFIAQWFPKIGVHWKGAWNCHQFHANTEFFADYGVYDVRLTLPDGFVVGATGALEGEVRTTDATRTFHFYQEDVHDFAWTASRRFVERKARFDDPGYPPVEIRVLLQPEHAHLAERHIEAAKIALRSYGAWAAPYPYAQLTIVDPAWHSDSGGMEYPTLFTAGTHVWAPPALRSPEAVTIHEAGHQFWYGLVGNNEFEEAWLDEGLNSYHDSKAAALFLEPEGWGRRYFGTRVGGRDRGGWPVVAPGVLLGRGEGRLARLRRSGKTDTMARRTWEFQTPDSYTLNAYGKPELTLQTLEGLLGDETMTRVMRTYGRRFRFGHPTSKDFVDTVNEVTGQDYGWFFDQTLYSSDLCDYAISARNTKARRLEGFPEGPDGAPAPAPVPAPKGDDAGPYDSEVVVTRVGEVRMPVDVLVQFADGQEVTERWDGQYRWTRFRYHRPVKVRRAVVDPQGKLALDVNPANNSWLDEEGQSRRAALKWSARWMLWLQSLLELHAVLG